MQVLDQLSHNKHFLFSQTSFYKPKIYLLKNAGLVHLSLADLDPTITVQY